MKDRLAKAEALNPQIHAFIRFTPELALDQAKAADSAADGRHVEGTAGPGDRPQGHLRNRRHPHHRPFARADRPCAEADAAAVTAWADAGAVMLGKLATHEFAFGGPSFDLPWPPTRNPWNTDHFTGGSSSGTGAALAAGVILGGTGSDTGGSIRSLAVRHGGDQADLGCARARVLPLSHTLDTVGPLAWTEDCAIMLDALTGYEDSHRPSSSQPAEARPADRPERRREGPLDRRDPAFPRADCPVTPGKRPASPMWSRRSKVSARSSRKSRCPRCSTSTRPRPDDPRGGLRRA